MSVQKSKVLFCSLALISISQVASAGGLKLICQSLINEFGFHTGIIDSGDFERQRYHDRKSAGVLTDSDRRRFSASFDEGNSDAFHSPARRSTRKKYKSVQISSTDPESTTGAWFSRNFLGDYILFSDRFFAREFIYTTHALDRESPLGAAYIVYALMQEGVGSENAISGVLRARNSPRVDGNPFLQFGTNWFSENIAFIKERIENSSPEFQRRLQEIQDSLNAAKPTP